MGFGALVCAVVAAGPQQRPAHRRHTHTAIVCYSIKNFIFLGGERYYGTQPAIAEAVDVRAGAAPLRACLDWRNIGKMFFSILLVSYTDGGLVVVKSNKQTIKHTYTHLLIQHTYPYQPPM